MRLRRRGSWVGAGARDKWVTVQARPDESTSDSGFPVDGPWADLATVAMYRDDLEATEVARGDTTIAVVTTRWEMPYRADCDPERVDVPKLRRLLYLGRTYDIVSAAPLGRQRALEIMTEATSKSPTEGAP